MVFDTDFQTSEIFRNPFDMADLDGIKALRPTTKIDTDVEHFPSFSSASGSTCPSLTSSFLSAVSSPLAEDGSRRLSVDSTESFAIDSFSPHYTSGTVSPSTPLTSSDLVDSSSMMCLSGEMNMPQMYAYQDNSDGFWMSQDSKAMSMMSPVGYLDGQQSIGQNQMRTYLPGQGHQIPDSTLSRSIFQGSQPSDEMSSQDGIFQWPSTVQSTPPQTVAPSATFQAVMASPHGYPMAPATPSPLRYHAPSTPTLKSSPFSPFSPGSSYSSSISSAQHVGERLRHVIDPRGSMTPCRSSSSKKMARRNDQYKVNKSKSLSSYSLPLTIEANKFRCDREDCKDKQGKRKAFKRSEHLKRHINTCHSGKREHVCWVEGCKRQFSRSDNLSTHLKQTHGRKSNGQRNRYVATLDETSVYYAPDYKGPLDTEGRPLKAIGGERKDS